MELIHTEPLPALDSATHRQTLIRVPRDLERYGFSAEFEGHEGEIVLMVAGREALQMDGGDTLRDSDPGHRIVNVARYYAGDEQELRAKLVELGGEYTPLR